MGLAAVARITVACRGVSMLADSAQAGARYEATITRTSFGMPHIKAKNFGGLGFGAAYAEAEDNICLMADAYVSSAGERSKFFGADGDTLIALWPGKNIANDVFFRAAFDMDSLRAVFATRSADYRALVDGWVAGYNHFLRNHASRLPAECAGQPWVRVDDSIEKPANDRSTSSRVMATLYRRDYVQNSNDNYRWTNPHAPMPDLGPIVGKDPEGFPDMRTRSGLQEIGRVLKSRKFDIDLAAQTMFENKNFAAQFALPSILELCKRGTAPTDACAALAKWDGRAELESRSAMLFTLFWSRASQHSDLWAIPFDPADPVNTPRSLVVDGASGDALLKDLAAAAETLNKLGVPLDAPLGDVQFAERGAERIPISGAPNGGVLNYTAQRPVKSGFAVFHGASYIQAVTFDDKGPVAKAVLTYSQSTNPASPHYADQTREFSKKRLHRVPFTDAEIAADAIGKPVTVRQ